MDDKISSYINQFSTILQCKLVLQTQWEWEWECKELSNEKIKPLTSSLFSKNEVV